MDDSQQVSPPLTFNTSKPDTGNFTLSDPDVDAPQHPRDDAINVGVFNKHRR